MKKHWIMASIVLALLLLPGCGGTAAKPADAAGTTPPQAEERTPAAEYSFTLEEDENRVVENTVFEKDVTISGARAQIVFDNCVFNGDIINTSEAGASVTITGSEVNGTCILRSGRKEAVMEDPFPKFLLDTPAKVVCEDCFGGAVALGDFELHFNGETYTMQDASLFFDATNPDAGFVPYEGQEASLLAAAQWWENGEPQLLIECEFDPNL